MLPISVGQTWVQMETLECRAPQGVSKSLERPASFPVPLLGIAALDHEHKDEPHRGLSTVTRFKIARERKPERCQGSEPKEMRKSQGSSHRDGERCPGIQ